MAGHASGWAKISKGPLKGMRVFVSKKIQARYAGGIKDVAHNMSLTAALEKGTNKKDLVLDVLASQPKGVAKPKLATIEAVNAMKAGGETVEISLSMPNPNPGKGKKKIVMQKVEAVIKDGLAVHPSPDGKGGVNESGKHTITHPATGFAIGVFASEADAWEVHQKIAALNFPWDAITKTGLPKELVGEYQKVAAIVGAKEVVVKAQALAVQQASEAQSAKEYALKKMDTYKPWPKPANATSVAEWHETNGKIIEDVYELSELVKDTNYKLYKRVGALMAYYVKPASETNMEPYTPTKATPAEKQAMLKAHEQFYDEAAGLYAKIRKSIEKIGV